MILFFCIFEKLKASVTVVAWKRVACILSIDTNNFTPGINSVV